MPNHATLITALILDQPMCGGCIAAKSGYSATEIETTIADIRTHQTLLLRTFSNAQCRVCGAITTVFSVDRP